MHQASELWTDDCLGDYLAEITAATWSSYTSKAQKTVNGTFEKRFVQQSSKIRHSYHFDRGDTDRFREDISVLVSLCKYFISRKRYNRFLKQILTEWKASVFRLSDG